MAKNKPEEAANGLGQDYGKVFALSVRNMRKLLCAVVMAALVHSGPVIAEPESRYVVGLGLPNMTSLSLWMNGDNSAWGLEIGKGSTISKRDGKSWFSLVGPDGEILEEWLDDTGRWEVKAIVSLTHHRYGEWRGKIRPLVFMQLFERSAHVFLDKVGESRKSSWEIGCRAGIGVAWKPFERVGMRAQKGLGVQLHRSGEFKGANNQVISLVMGGTRTEAFFVF